MNEDGWYMPKWEDHAKWKRQYKNKSEHIQDGEFFRKTYSSLKEFKDHCFNYMKTKIDECHSSSEHCVECIRKSEWD